MQKEFSGSLSPERKEAHPKQIHEFRDALRDHDVPTIHIGYGDIWRDDSYNRGNIKHVARCSPWRAQLPEPREEAGTLAALGFLVLPYKDEEIVEKYFDDAFAKSSPHSTDPGLAGLLQGCGAKTVIMTGGNTTACVYASAHGALRAGFDLMVVYDRLADDGYPNKDANPIWHKKQMDQLYSEWRKTSIRLASPARLRIVTAKECLTLVAEQNNQPAPQRTAQSSNRPSLG